MLSPHQYMREGVITRTAGIATVSADYAIPLQQAATAIAQEYGWAVHYEDPPYSGKHDLMDMTNPAYRAAHPDAKVVLGPAGGAFKSSYRESPSMWSSSAMELEVLEKVVSDYNQSGGPGHFEVRCLSDGSCDVIGDAVHDDMGSSIPIIPVLDTPITLPVKMRRGEQALQALLDALSSKIGIPMYVYQAPDYELGLECTAVGGESVPAREFLVQILNGLSRAVLNAFPPKTGTPTVYYKYRWILHYIPQPRQYVLGIFPVARAAYDAFGHKQLIPVCPMPVPSGTQ
jgi:hypothetical protein